MKVLILLVTASFIFCLSSAVIAQPAATDQVSGEQLKKQASETLDTAKKYTLQQKEEFQKKMEVELQDLSKRFDELKKKADSSKGDALTALEARLADLKSQQKDVEQKLNELKSSTARAWEETKTKVEQAVDTLKKAYEAVGK